MRIELFGLLGILFINVGIVLIGSLKEKSKLLTILSSIFVMFIGICFILIAEQRVGYKDALDGKNPYHKEYVYKQLPSGQYVKTDSIYVRTKKK